MPVALFEEIELAGQVCILIPDEIVATPADDLVLLQDGGALSEHKFWVHEKDLVKARQINPHAAVYGFWQTLLTSDCIDSEQSIQIFSQDRRTGLYLHLDGSRVVGAGQFTGGRFPFEIPYSVVDAESIEANDASALLRPSIFARLPAEIHAGRRRATRRRMSVGCVAGVLICACGVGYSVYQHMLAQQRAQALSALQSKTLAARGTLSRLKARHNLGHDTLASRQTLVYLLDLSHYSASMKIAPTNIGAEHVQFAAQVDHLSADLPWATEITPESDGSYMVRYVTGQPGGGAQ